MSQSHLQDRAPGVEVTGTLRVAVQRVDDEVQSGRLRPPDVLKIDVEGSEIDVLAGARQTLNEHRPVVICELHETNREVYDLLSTLGYELENLDGPQPVVDAGAAHVLARWAR